MDKDVNKNKDKDTKHIKICKGGPYLVYGNPSIVQEIIIPDEDGASWEYKKTAQFKPTSNPVALCRCGRSAEAPFCDGSHAKAAWDEEETASFAPLKSKAEKFEGPSLTLLDNEDYCAYARFCDAKGRIWNLVMEGTPEADELAIKECCGCCSGRLVVQDKNGEDIEEKFQEEISVLEDPAMECSGPLWVKGGIRIESSHGKNYEVRNRQTICRCGQSSNKPFCDGSHASIKFDDKIK